VGSIEEPVVSLSGGNQQKVVLAKCIAANSRVLLLNQPTRGVDIGSKAEIYQLIRETCSSQGVGAMVVSREINELKGLCDRILVMSYGRLVAEFDPSASEEEVLKACVGF
jgi:ABC-type sugar transport system ATPase subunit